MENFGEWEQKNLKNELLKGKELAKELQIHLNLIPSSSMGISSSSSFDIGGELLVEKILSSYEKALSLLNSNGIQVFESCSSLIESPKSEEDSDHDQKKSSSRRNVLPTWTQKFQVSPGMALESSLDDGFCWRKYGQKGILGAKHPRGYYRCTHRKLQSCLATKKVQRSDDDPSVFEITYRGNHTCRQVTNFSTPSATQQQQNCTIESNLNQLNNHEDQKVQNQQITPPDELLNSWASLRVRTENYEPTLLFPPFSYDPTSNHEAADRVETTFSPSFLSPTTSAGSGLSYFSAASSSGGLSMSEGFVGNQKLNLLEPNKSEIFSSQTLGLEFPFAELEMEPSFTFNNTNFF